MMSQVSARTLSTHQTQIFQSDKKFEQRGKKSTVSCSFCDFSCNSSMCVTQHQEVRHKNKHLSPSGDCCKTPPLPSLHIPQDRRSNTFLCVQCNMNFSHMCHFKKHLKNHIIKVPSQVCSPDFAGCAQMEIKDIQSTPGRKFLCSMCGVFLSTLGALKTHKCKPCEIKLFTCLICRRTFSTKAHLKSHEYIHTDQKSFSCPNCRYSCRKSQYLKRHMLTHSVEKTLLCSICGQSFIFPETLKRHMHKHAPEKPFSCSECSFTTSDPSSLTRHMVKHISNFFSCNSCSYSCIGEAEMEKHKLTHALQSYIPCPSCSLTFADLKELQAHTLTHMVQSGPNYSCSFCQFNCQIQKEYVQHMQAHSVDKPFACTVCDYHSNRRMNLKVHMKKQHGLSLASIVSFTCKLCQFACERDQDYIKHMSVAHKIDKPFDCPVCQFSTHRQGLLKVHMETHKPHGFFCQLCSFKCKRKTLLNKHLAAKHFNNNLDENVAHFPDKKVYACKSCDFVSKHYASLRNHMPVHSNVKFPCDECSYVTYSQRNLISHKRTHMKEKSYKCLFCNYASARKNNFKLHIVRHKDEKLYCCTHCDYTSKSQDDLSEHAAAMHIVGMPDVNNTSAKVITIFQTSGPGDLLVKPTKSANDNLTDWSPLTSHQGRYSSNSAQLELTHECDSNSQLVTSCVTSDLIGPNNNKEQVESNTSSEHIIANADIPVECNTGSEHINTGGSLSLSYLTADLPGTIPSDSSTCSQFREILPQPSICLIASETGYYIGGQSVTPVQQLSRAHGFTSAGALAGITENLRETFPAPNSFGPLGASGPQYQTACSGNLTCTEACQITILQSIPQYDTFHQFHNSAAQFSEHNVRGIELSPQSVVPGLGHSLTSQAEVLHYDHTAKEANDFSQHMAKLWDDGLYTCPVCSFRCSNEQELQQHSLLHSSSPLSEPLGFACVACKMAFATSESLDQHSLQCHFQSGLVEDYVSQSSSAQVIAPKFDDTTRANEKVYRCFQCTFECVRPSDFKRHMMAVHGTEKAFTCKLCPYSCKREDDMKTHAITHDEAMIRSCSVCDYTCKRVPALRRHMRKHADLKLFSCSSCDFWCNYEPDLRSHVLKVHEKPRHFACHLCQYTSGFASHFKKHMSSVHSVENAFSCPHCNYSSPLWNNFRAHKVKHSGTRKYSCHVCGHTFKRVSGLKNHMAIHGGQRSLKCYKCNYHCDLMGKLKIHMRRHTSDCPYICKICQRRYTHSSSLYKHISLVHTNAKRHFCSLCTYATSTISLLKRHMLTHGVGKRFECCVCQFACNHNEVLENHMLLHNPHVLTYGTEVKEAVPFKTTQSDNVNSKTGSKGEKDARCTDNTALTRCSKFTCFTCSHTFSSTSNFKKHMQRHKKSGHVIKFICSICPFSCLRPFELKLHTSVHTGLNPFSCDQCDFVCNKPYTLKYHKQQKHQQNRSDGTKHKDANMLTCHICNFSCSKSIYLKFHLEQKHGGSEPRVSNTENSVNHSIGIPTSSVHHSLGIPTSTDQKSSLLHGTVGCVRHMSYNVAMHSRDWVSEKHFICDLCNYSTKSKGNLVTHMQRHESKQFLCHLCDYMCRKERELKRHLLTHERGKPLSCQLCPYTCIQSANLRIHLLKHKGEKPIQCHLCNFKCRQRSTLRDHMTTHSTERKFACDLCDYRAKRAISLKMHKFTHSVDRPVSCTLCDFTCKHASALRSHMRSHANDKLYS